MAATPTAFDSRSFLKTLAALPGVYRMLDERGRVLYVGKARNLRQRVASYFRDNQASAKTRSLVAHIRAIEAVSYTHLVSPCRYSTDLVSMAAWLKAGNSRASNSNSTLGMAISPSGLW